jgi:hypothetical protein
MDEPAALNKPVILIADDEPVPLAAMANVLVRRYGEDYRIVAHSSSRATLDDRGGASERHGSPGGGVCEAGGGDL